MSTDWSIRCLDCGETMEFPVSGHGYWVTKALVDHAETIAKLAPLIEDGVELRTRYEDLLDLVFRFGDGTIEKCREKFQAKFGYDVGASVGLRLETKEPQ